MSQQTNDEAFAKLLKELEEEPKTQEELIYDEYDEYAIIITQFVLKHLLKKMNFLKMPIVKKQWLKLWNSMMNCVKS